MMFLWLILAAIAIAAVWYFSITPHKKQEEQNPLGVIEQHYANGEISEEEFKKHKSNLEKE